MVIGVAPPIVRVTELHYTFLSLYGFTIRMSLSHMVYLLEHLEGRLNSMIDSVPKGPKIISDILSQIL